MKSILFIQYGDFRDAYQRLANGGAETYRDQKKSVDFVASLAPNIRTTTLSLGPQDYHTELAPGLWAVGLRFNALRPSDITRIFDAAEPSHVVLRTPHVGFLREVQRRNVWLLPSFADIFVRKGVRKALQNLVLRRALSQCRTPCISNHSLNASFSVVSVLGFPSERVVPWDWSKIPLAGAAKNGVADPTRPTAFFAGAMTEDKGVGDCLDAIVELRKGGLRFHMSFAGPGDLEPWKSKTVALGISDQVSFLGVISNKRVREEMRQSDFVIVPSRHVYAEGLPNTIYEGLASRSVLVISDHPAFAGRLEPGKECLAFPAAKPKSLAQCLNQAIRNKTIYQRISENSDRAHNNLYVGMEWAALVEAFIEDPENKSSWVEKNSLKSLGKVDANLFSAHRR